MLEESPAVKNWRKLGDSDMLALGAFYAQTALKGLQTDRKLFNHSLGLLNQIYEDYSHTGRGSIVNTGTGAGIRYSESDGPLPLKQFLPPVSSAESTEIFLRTSSNIYLITIDKDHRATFSSRRFRDDGEAPMNLPGEFLSYHGIKIGQPFFYYSMDGTIGNTSPITEVIVRGPTVNLGGFTFMDGEHPRVGQSTIDDEYFGRPSASNELGSGLGFGA